MFPFLIDEGLLASAVMVALLACACGVVVLLKPKARRPRTLAAVGTACGFVVILHLAGASLVYFEGLHGRLDGGDMAIWYLIFLPFLSLIAAASLGFVFVRRVTRGGCEGNS